VNETSFAEFLDSHRKDLLRISRATRGEASLEDVQAEAWLLIADLGSKGLRIDLRLAEHQQLVLARLYQHLVRYTELNVRYAIRLDHSPGGQEGEVHPLAHLLAADERSDPIVALMHAQDQMNIDPEVLSPHRSLAGAYLYLLDHLNNQMDALAEHLLISLSYCYRRCSHARVLATHQQPLPASAMPKDETFIPSAWRQFRLQRQQEQLNLDLEWSEALFRE
jgi:hypothetical protein